MVVFAESGMGGIQSFENIGFGLDVLGTASEFQEELL